MLAIQIKWKFSWKRILKIFYLRSGYLRYRHIYRWILTKFMIEDKYKIVDNFGHFCLFLALLDHLISFWCPKALFIVMGCFCQFWALWPLFDRWHYWYTISLDFNCHDGRKICLMIATYERRRIINTNCTAAFQLCSSQNSGVIIVTL